MSQNSALPSRVRDVLSRTNWSICGGVGTASWLSGRTSPPCLAAAERQPPAPRATRVASERTDRARRVRRDAGMRQRYCGASPAVNRAARIVRGPGTDRRERATACAKRLGRGFSPGVLELLAAARAERVVELDRAAAARALALGLLGVVAVQQRGGEAEERQDRRDEEPQDEGRALEASDDPSGQAEADGDHDVRHGPSELADRPHDPDDREHDHDQGRQAGEDADDDLEQDPRRDDEDDEGDEAGDEARASSFLFHASIVEALQVRVPRLPLRAVVALELEAGEAVAADLGLLVRAAGRTEQDEAGYGGGCYGSHDASGERFGDWTAGRRVEDRLGT